MHFHVNVFVKIQHVVQIQCLKKGKWDHYRLLQSTAVLSRLSLSQEALASWCCLLRQHTMHREEKKIERKKKTLSDPFIYNHSGVDLALSLYQPGSLSEA